MQTAKDVEVFESNNGTVVLKTVGTRYIVTTAQRIRMDLVWTTESVRPTLAEAMNLFAHHKKLIEATRGHCTGDNNILVTKFQEQKAYVSRLGQCVANDSHIR